MHGIKLDIRWPIGLLFTLQGALLMIWGMLHPEGPDGVIAAYGANHLWGAAMLVFGLLMLALAWRHRRASRGTPAV